MKFAVLEQGRMARIVALCPEDADVSMLEVDLAGFVGHGGPVAKAVAGMMALFSKFADNGRVRSTRLFHEANKRQSIYEFSKGSLRVYFFFSSDGGEIVVCSHVMRKKKQRADSSDIDRAADLRERYLAAQADGRIEYVTRGKKP